MEFVLLATQCKEKKIKYNNNKEKRKTFAISKNDVVIYLIRYTFFDVAVEFINGFVLLQMRLEFDLNAGQVATVSGFLHLRLSFTIKTKETRQK